MPSRRTDGRLQSEAASDAKRPPVLRPVCDAARRAARPPPPLRVRDYTGSFDVQYKHHYFYRYRFFCSPYAVYQTKRDLSRPEERYTLGRSDGHSHTAGMSCSTARGTPPRTLSRRLSLSGHIHVRSEKRHGACSRLRSRHKPRMKADAPERSRGRFRPRAIPAAPSTDT